MDPNSIKTMAAAAGAAGGDPVYVDDVFSTYVYVGNGSTKTINNGIDLSGEGGLVWIKKRDTTGDHMLFDTARGASGYFHSNSNVQSSPSANYLTSFNSNGFSLTFGGSVNNDGTDFVSWSFRKQKGFFDIVTWTGNDGGDRTLSHDLGSVPGCVIVKRTNGSMDWGVYHRELGTAQTDGLILNDTDATGGSNINPIRSTPTSTQIEVRGGTNEYNTDTETYIAYLFAHDDQRFGDAGNESIVKCGAVTTAADEYATVDLGFEPQFVMFKRTDSSGNWLMLDTMRGWDNNNDDKRLYADLDNLESTTPSGHGEVNHTGFRIYNLGGSADLAYMAIRRPHKTPEAGTEVYETVKYTGNATARQVATTIAADTIIAHRRSGSQDHFLFDRLRGSYKYMRTSTQSEEAAQSSAITTIGNNYLDMGSGSIVNDNQSVTDNMCLHMFRRAPGFFDIVCYDGDSSSSRNISHNLGSVPELIITKGRDFDNHWMVYHKDVGNTKYMELNGSGGAYTGAAAWNDTTPTSTVFTVGGDNAVNYDTKKHIAYLFATLPGISKVGTYSGTGNDIDVDCGFTAGARFVLVVQTNGAGEWCLMDTVRGITAGDDYISFPSDTAAEEYTTSLIDPHNPGFQITDDAPDQMNVSGGTYVYLAIA